MKGKQFLAVLVLIINISGLFAQDNPRRCNNNVAPFNDIMKGKLISQVKTAHQYFMTSTDPAAGTNYTERTANLQAEVSKTFQTFITTRSEEYRKVVCNYYKTDWNKAGNSSWRTIDVQSGFYLLKNTMKKTEDGDMKQGPYLLPENSEFPTQVKWKTGGHRASKTFVDIDAKYTEKAIGKEVLKELNLARAELNAMGIPTELPPLK